MSEKRTGPFGRHRAKLVASLIVGGLVAIIGFTIVLSRGDPKPKAGAPVPTTQPGAESGAAADELVRLLDAGAKLAFDGRYTATQDGGGALSTLRLWQKPPMVRLDMESGSGAELRRTGQFALPSGPVSCARQPDGTWTCKSEPGLRLRSGLVPEGIASQLARLAVEGRSERVNNEEARCFSITGGETRADVCLTPDGVPIRVVVNAVRIELAQLDRSPPPDEIFDPPAPLS